MQDELLSISKRSENIIFSHETALYLHGISDRTPFEHTVTAPSGCIPSAAIRTECKVYYIKPELFELGKTTLRTPALLAISKLYARIFNKSELVNATYSF
jgi:predicted transcriptional regulator of viral defense system